MVLRGFKFFFPAKNTGRFIVERRSDSADSFTLPPYVVSSSCQKKKLRRKVKINGRYACRAIFRAHGLWRRVLFHEQQGKSHNTLPSVVPRSRKTTHRKEFFLDENMPARSRHKPQTEIQKGSTLYVALVCLAGRLRLSYRLYLACFLVTARFELTPSPVSLRVVRVASYLRSRLHEEVQ